MNVPCFQIDAFADRPFSGNPAAVCLLEDEADSDWMQAVASEMNLSETAFVRPFQDGYELRWFTPAFEVDLCGHATLASAHMLWTEGHTTISDPIRFHTRSGVLTCKQDGESDDPAFDFVSRFFAPAAGVNEDPVTGSAHCCLGPFWQDRLGNSEMMAYQASKRGGVVRVQVKGDRVLLGGKAITVMKGELRV